MSDKIEVGVIGAGGFTGRELFFYLAGHPRLEIVHATSDRHAGSKLGEVFADLDGKSNLVFKKHDDPLPDNIPVFLATPNETSLALTPQLLKAGSKVVDLSGVFRLHDREVFEKYYGLNHDAFELMNKCVYGMSEIFRESIKTTRLCANPGCYPTAAILPIFYLGEHRAQISDIVIDAKSGVSGAGGRTEDSLFAFNSVYENFRAYKVLKHQHHPEIEEYAGTNGTLDAAIAFTPHLLPCFRGILCTTYILWKERAPANLIESVQERTSREPFIRFRESPEEVQLSAVQNTNFLDFGLRSEGRRTVMVSAIDNLVKGAAGQAIQNMNLMLGLPETAGLI